MTSAVATQIERVKYRLIGRIVLDVVSFAMDTKIGELCSWEVLGRIRDIHVSDLMHLQSAYPIAFAFQMVDWNHGGAKSDAWYHGDAYVVEVEQQVDTNTILVRCKGCGPLKLVTT